MLSSLNEAKKHASTDNGNKTDKHQHQRRAGDGQIKWFKCTSSCNSLLCFIYMKNWKKKKKRGSGACSHASQWAVWASDGTSVFPTHRLYLGRAPRYIKVCPSIFADSKIISFEIIFTWFCSFRSSGKFILDIHFLGSLTFMWFFLIFFFKVKVQ